MKPIISEREEIQRQDNGDKEGLCSLCEGRGSGECEGCFKTSSNEGIILPQSPTKIPILCPPYPPISSQTCQKCLKTLSDPLSQIESKSQQKSTPNALLICTKCHLHLHYQCTSIPSEILDSCNYFFEGNQNCLCPPCIDTIKYAKILKSQVFVDEKGETLYFFVNVIDPSPIHCFWIDEKSLCDKIQKGLLIMLTNVPLIQTKMPKNTVQFEQSIEKIIDFRAPGQNLGVLEKALKLKQRIFNCDNPISSYGSSSNFSFLVKWTNQTIYTWEDETVVFNYFFQVKKFICRSLFEGYIYSGKPVTMTQIQQQVFQKSQITDLLRVTLSPKPSKVLNISFSSKTSVYETVYRRQSIQLLREIVNKQKSIEIIQKAIISNYIQIFCQIIMNNFINNTNFNSHSSLNFHGFQQNSQNFTNDKEKRIKPQLNIIIGDQKCVESWEKQIKTKCPLIDLIVWKQGVDIQFSKMNQFSFKHINYPQFQVLLLTYQLFVSQNQFIFEALVELTKIFWDQSVTKLIILDNFVQGTEQKIKLDQVQFPPFQKLLVFEDKTNVRNLGFQLHRNFSEMQINTFNFNTPNVRNTLHENKDYQLSFPNISILTKIEAQKMCCIMYLMQFGLVEISSISDFVQKVKNKFGQFFQKNNEKKQKQLQIYISSLLSELKSHKSLDNNINIFGMDVQICQIS